MTHIKKLEDKISEQKRTLACLNRKLKRYKKLNKNQENSICNLKETVADMQFEILRLTDIVERIYDKFPEESDKIVGVANV